MANKTKKKNLKAAKKTYTEEFKREAVRLALSGDKGRAEVASDLGVTYNSLSGWITKYAKPLRIEGKVPQLSDEQRVRELEREVRELKMERDILKNCLLSRTAAPVMKETPANEYGSLLRKERPSAFWWLMTPLKNLVQDAVRT